MKQLIVPVWAWGVLLGTGLSLVWSWAPGMVWVCWLVAVVVLVWRVCGTQIDFQLLIISVLVGLLLGQARAVWWINQHHQLAASQWTGLAVVTEVHHRGFSWEATLLWDRPGPFPATTASVYQELVVGSLVAADCQLQPHQPVSWLDPAYARLAHGIAGSCEQIDLQLLTTSTQALSWQLLTHPSRFTLTALAARLRQAVQQKIIQTYDPPLVWLASGLLIGERGGWSQSFTTLFQRVGLSHIVALSGWNVTILSGVVLWILIRWGCSARVAAVGGLSVVVSFVIFTGASASLVRAAIMFGLCVLARWLSRPQSATRVLLITAALMVLAKPALLMWDVSFQLSLLATLALVVGGWSFFDSFEAPVWEVSQTVRTTLAVTILTLPYMLWKFGRFSLVAIPLNILILPMLPLATAGAALGTLLTWAGIHSTTLSWLTALPMQLIITAARCASLLPWASVSWQ